MRNSPERLAAVHRRLYISAGVGVVVAIGLGVTSIVLWMTQPHQPGQQPTFAFMGEALGGAIVAWIVFMVWTAGVGIQEAYQKYASDRAALERMTKSPADEDADRGQTK